MKRGYDYPKWLVQLNAGLEGLTNDRFEHVVPLGEQSRYRHIETISGILEALYSESKYPITIPQLYYHLQRSGHVSHSVRAQSMMLNYITTGLQWGLIDWDHIQNTAMTSVSHRPTDPSGWAGSQHYVEVWIEKPGFEHILNRVCAGAGVTWRVLKGRPTSVDIYATVERIHTEADGRKPVVVYLCDLDPVAFATRDSISEHLNVLGASDIKFHYAMLQEKQINDMSLPANPLSVTAVGAQSYLDVYGTSQWELESLSPIEFASIVKGVLAYYAKQ